MFHDGRCYIHIPSYLTLSLLSAEAAAHINQVHAQIGQPTGFAEGGQNPYILLLNDFDMGGAPFSRGRGAELAWLGPVDNQSFLTLDQISLIIMFGGEVEGLPVWFRFDDPTAVCPFSDSDETWETWGVFSESHKPVQIDDHWYRSSAVGQSGQLLDASQWVPLRNAGAVTVLTMHEYQAVQASEGPE